MPWDGSGDSVGWGETGSPCPSGTQCHTIAPWSAATMLPARAGARMLLTDFHGWILQAQLLLLQKQLSKKNVMPRYITLG